LIVEKYILIIIELNAKRKVFRNLEMALIDYDGFKCKTIKIPKILDVILK